MNTAKVSRTFRGSRLQVPVLSTASFGCHGNLNKFSSQPYTTQWCLGRHYRTPQGSAGGLCIAWLQCYTNSAHFTWGSVGQRSCTIHKLHISMTKVLCFPNLCGHCTITWSKTIKTNSLGDLKITKTFEDTIFDNSVTSLLSYYLLVSTKTLRGLWVLKLNMAARNTSLFFKIQVFIKYNEFLIC